MLCCYSDAQIIGRKKNTTKYIFKFFPAAWIITQDSINHCWCASLFPVAVNNQPQIVFVSSFWSVQESVGCGVLPPGKDPSLLFGSMFFSDRLFAQEDVSISSVAFFFLTGAGGETSYGTTCTVKLLYMLPVGCQGFTVMQAELLSTVHTEFGQGSMYKTSDDS